MGYKAAGHTAAARSCACASGQDSNGGRKCLQFTGALAPPAPPRRHATTCHEGPALFKPLLFPAARLLATPCSPLFQVESYEFSFLVLATTASLATLQGFCCAVECCRLEPAKAVR